MRKPTKLQQLDHSVVVYHHTPEFETSRDDLAKPDYWTHVAAQLRPGHRIEVMAPDGAYWAMLLVRSASRLEAVVQELQFVKLGKAEAAATPDQAYEVKWRGPSAKFSVIRISDGEIIREQIESKEAATQWLKNHEKSLAA